MLGMVLVAGCTPSVQPGALLEVPPPHGWEAQQNVGSVFTDAFETLDVVSQPITLTDVRFEGGEPGIELIGYEIVPPGRHYATLQRLPGFPPVSTDLPTTRVRPGDELVPDPTRQGYELLLGVKVAAEGRWVRSGIVVHYRNAGRDYVQTLPAELVVCTPRYWQPDGRC